MVKMKLAKKPLLYTLSNDRRRTGHEVRPQQPDLKRLGDAGELALLACSDNPQLLPESGDSSNRRGKLTRAVDQADCAQHVAAGVIENKNFLVGAAAPAQLFPLCKVVVKLTRSGRREAMHSLRSNWPGARHEGGSVSAAILDRASNEAPGQFQRNPSGGSSFSLRRRCSLLTDPRGVCSSLAPSLGEKSLAANV